MSNKKVLLLIDNRAKAVEDSFTDLRVNPISDFKGSAFKGRINLNTATEIDVEEDQPSVEYNYLTQLQRKVEEL